ncbi:MAG: hypothetical protein HYT46_01615, partial [Candidatus Vogelbacteria bacterium]|nr:hypothetical protein [Candidatus Vogelbacteria bacterium]
MSQDRDSPNGKVRIQAGLVIAPPASVFSLIIVTVSKTGIWPKTRFQLPQNALAIKTANAIQRTVNLVQSFFSTILTPCLSL